MQTDSNICPSARFNSYNQSDEVRHAAPIFPELNPRTDLSVLVYIAVSLVSSLSQA